MRPGPMLCFHFEWFGWPRSLSAGAALGGMFLDFGAFWTLALASSLGSHYSRTR
jgi:hypothetical protein